MLFLLLMFWYEGKGDVSLVDSKNFTFTGFKQCWQPWSSSSCNCCVDVSSPSYSKPQASSSQTFPRLLVILRSNGIYSSWLRYLYYSLVVRHLLQWIMAFVQSCLSWLEICTLWCDYRNTNTVSWRDYFDDFISLSLFVCSVRPPL